MNIWLATQDGVVHMAGEGSSWVEKGRSLVGRHVTSIIARQGVILAGTTDGIQRSDDQGRTWQDASAGLSERHVRWLAYHPGVSDLELVGTEPAAVFISEDGARSWQERPEVAALCRQYGWMLPYSPNAGCIRGLRSRRPIRRRRGWRRSARTTGQSWALAPAARAGASTSRRQADPPTYTASPYTPATRPRLAPTGSSPSARTTAARAGRTFTAATAAPSGETRQTPTTHLRPPTALTGSPHRRKP